jgi:hypothetical protein
LRQSDVLTEYKRSPLSRSASAFYHSTRIFDSIRKTRPDFVFPTEQQLNPDYYRIVGQGARDIEKGASYVQPFYSYSMLKNIDYSAVAYNRAKRSKRMKSLVRAKRVLEAFLEDHNGLINKRASKRNPFMLRFGNIAVLRRLPASGDEMFNEGYAKRTVLYNPVMFGMVYNHRYYY